MTLKTWPSDPLAVVQAIALLEERRNSMPSGRVKLLCVSVCLALLGPKAAYWAFLKLSLTCTCRLPVFSLTPISNHPFRIQQ